MPGVSAHVTVTTCAHVLLLPHPSVANHVRVTDCWQSPFGTVLMMVTVIFVLQSLAIGASKLQFVKQSTVLLVAQVRTGGVVSITVTVCEQLVVLLQQSVPCQV